MDKIPMTPSGHVALTEEYRRRTAEERPAIIAAISEARAHGDLSENAEYHAAKEQQSLNEGRIQELESLLALARSDRRFQALWRHREVRRHGQDSDEDSEEEKTYMSATPRRMRPWPHLPILAHRPGPDRQGGR